MQSKTNLLMNNLTIKNKNMKIPFQVIFQSVDIRFYKEKFQNCYLEMFLLLLPLGKDKLKMMTLLSSRSAEKRKVILL